jgi:hypothetical protein
MSQIIRENPSCIMKNVSGQSVIAKGWMQFVFFLKQLGQENTILLIPIQLPLPCFPFVVTGAVDPHDLA